MVLYFSPFLHVAGAPCVCRYSHVSVGHSLHVVHFALGSCYAYASNLAPLLESKPP